MARTRTKRSAEAWWADEAETVSNLPDNARRTTWGRRLWIGYVWSAVVLLPVAVLAVLLVAGQAAPAGPAPVADDTTSEVTADTAQAQLTVQSWLAREPAPLPGGRIVGFNGSSSVTPEPVDGEPAGYELTTFRFLVSDSTYRLYEASVQMSVSTVQGAVAIAAPAVVPLPGPDPGSLAADVWPWPGVEQGGVTDTYNTAISSWLEAYSSGEPARLKQSVGDPDDTRSYQPMTGVEAAEFSVTEVGQLWGPDQDPQIEDRPTQALVRVQLAITWPTDTPEEEAPTESTPMTMDLLLDRANSGSPVVVAWAPPGQQLSPYMNGSARTPAAEENTPAPPSPSPSSTPR